MGVAASGPPSSWRLAANRVPVWVRKVEVATAMVKVDVAVAPIAVGATARRKRTRGVAVDRRAPDAVLRLACTVDPVPLEVVVMLGSLSRTIPVPRARNVDVAVSADRVIPVGRERLMAKRSACWTSAVPARRLTSTSR